MPKFKVVAGLPFLTPYLDLAKVIGERASALDHTAAQVAVERCEAFHRLLREEVDGNVEQLWAKFWNLEGALRRSYQALN